MSALVVPEDAPGINLFSNPAWWAGSAVGREVGRDVGRTAYGVRVEDPELPWEGERSLLVVGPLRSWVAPGPVDAQLSALHEWREAVLALAAQAPSGTVRLVGLPEVPTKYVQLVALAAGRRWPAVDLDDAAAHGVDDAVVPPTADTADTADTDTAIRDFTTALGNALRPGLKPSWSTQAIGAADALEVLRAGLAADPTLAQEEALALRQESRATLEALAAAGVPASGRRDLLLWPAPVAGGRVPLDVAAEVAAEALRGQVERPTDWPAELDRITDLERAVEALRAEVRDAGARAPGLDTLPVRELTRLLRRNHR